MQGYGYDAARKGEIRAVKREKKTSNEQSLARSTSWKFFQQWLRSPLTVAAVSPSSRELAKLMVAELPAGTERVIELGGGTGVFTRAVLEAGVKPEQFMVFELNETLYQDLREEFVGTHVVCADARELKTVAQAEGFLINGAVDAVISGLGMLSMSKQLQLDIMSAVFSVLKPDGRFVQFTYGPSCPVNKEVLRELGLSAERTGFTLLNLPPASVYRVTRMKSKRVPTVSAVEKKR